MRAVILVEAANTRPEPMAEIGGRPGLRPHISRRTGRRTGGPSTPPIIHRPLGSAANARDRRGRRLPPLSGTGPSRTPLGHRNILRTRTAA